MEEVSNGKFKIRYTAMNPDNIKSPQSVKRTETYENISDYEEFISMYKRIQQKLGSGEKKKKRGLSVSESSSDLPQLSR